jgi:exopolyphosphatase/guanosine-5'-triphosphate,3'-diphosphate pyrophosphatase
LKILAAIDIGTNSVRLEVVRVEDDLRLTTLSQQKESVRLGEGEFEDGRLAPEAIQRGTLVIARFAEMARGFGADEILAVATSAVREAANRDEFIERCRELAQVDVRVVSGPEEARLIYLGVSTGANLGDKRALFIDIGGGSTELILGDASNHFLLDSIKLGSIRMANKFLLGEKGAMSPERFRKMVEHARAVAGHATRRFADFGFDTVYGSAGTITNLGLVTARRLGETPGSLRNYVVKAQELRASVEMLCGLNLEERRRVPGLDADRADIILGGAAVLMAVMEDTRAQEIVMSDRGTRHGILIDRLLLEGEARASYESTTVRERSILQLSRGCNFDEEHAEHISRLCLSLFDQLRSMGLHPYGKRERELLRYSALVHDIGCFLSHSNHQRHAYYLVRHSDLLGFNDTEIDVIANVAYYHRKSVPKKRHVNLQALSRQDRKLVSVLAGILRVAEGLDRSHLALVREVRLAAGKSGGQMELTLFSEADCQLELWGVETNKDLFEEEFAVKLSLRVEQPGGAALAAAGG